MVISSTSYIQVSLQLNPFTGRFMSTSHIDLLQIGLYRPPISTFTRYVYVDLPYRYSPSRSMSASHIDLHKREDAVASVRRSTRHGSDSVRTDEPNRNWDEKIGVFGSELEPLQCTILVSVPMVLVRFEPEEQRRENGTDGERNSTKTKKRVREREREVENQRVIQYFSGELTSSFFGRQPPNLRRLRCYYSPENVYCGGEMGFEEQQNSVPGCVPEFGAIFMSNSATKKECFKRKLLGLPFGLASFVKQVKAGMVLFLFEFEKRELHGVFQASSDGAINIVPQAFISSGKQFPAQVKFTPLWCCNPLCEDEFYDAIKENYFSKNKFNFGLSEDQVYKLLLLFSLRKLKVQPCQKQFTISKLRRAFDDGRSVMNNQLKDNGGRTVSIAGGGKEYQVDKLFEESLHQVGRVTDDGRFATTDCIGNKCDLDTDLRPVISAKYPEYSFDNEVGGRVLNDVMFAKVDNNGDNVSGAAVSTIYPGSFQPSSNTHNSNILQAASFVHDQLRRSSPQLSNLSCFTPLGVPNVTSTCPYDPDAPNINYWPSSSSEVNRSLNPGPVFDPSHNHNAGHIFPLVRNQPLLSCVEPVCTIRSSDVNSGFDYSALVPLSEKHHEYSGRTISPLFGAAYSETVEKYFSKNEGPRGISFLEPSSTPGPFSDCVDNDGMNEGPSSCSYSPSIYPSFVFDYGPHRRSQEKRDHEAFAGNPDPVELASTDHHDSYSLKPDVYTSSRNMYSDFKKNRISVFSRLSKDSKIHMEENVTLDDNNEEDTSADYIMSMLHQSQYQWVKMSNHAQFTKENAINFRKKRQTTSNSEILTVQKISKEIIMNGTPETEDNGEQFVATTYFVDFKRRSEVRKSHDDDSKISGCNENAEKSESGGLRKRRKLIRPTFNKNELPDFKSIDNSKKVEPHLLCQDKSIEAERVSNCREEMVENCGPPLRNVDENGRELSQKFGLGIMQLSVSPDEKRRLAEEVLSIKDSVMDGVSQDLKHSDQSGIESFLETHGKNVKGFTASEKVDKSFQDDDNSYQSTGQDFPLETCKVNATVSISSETEGCRGNEELYNFDKVYPLDGEMETNMVNNLSNQNPKSEKAAEDLVNGSRSEGCEMNLNQNVENKNELVLSSGDARQCQATSIQDHLKLLQTLL
ncbi:hypothetical protein Ddye_029726 [Dipteronia dyeriana]|uniref:DCD domain-containing protein n=1 Tax=Dipteronia dyeriana TaxID=168575 RepID=A0AAD9WKU6_9ROSI|nr:hypothetical protein Ddye_029726 [Dipteronia dyeriana]